MLELPRNRVHQEELGVEVDVLLLVVRRHWGFPAPFHEVVAALHPEVVPRHLRRTEADKPNQETINAVFRLMKCSMQKCKKQGGGWKGSTQERISKATPTLKSLQKMSSSSPPS